MNLEFPLLLLLSPLALLPWLVINTEKVIAWDVFIPEDSLSKMIDVTIKLLGSIVILSLIIALSGPYIPEYSMPQRSTGAEFVILLDRSRSMDEPFAVKDSAQKVSRDLTKSKRNAAVKHLERFVKLRSDDRWGFVMFSNKVMPLLPLTNNRQAVLATIQASALGKGMSETNLAKSLIQAADYFNEQQYRGSRVVLLVSDGGQALTQAEQNTISQTFRQHHLALYWIYLKSIRNFSLEERADEPPAWQDLPERKLHKFFLKMQMPYHVFEAETDADFSQAFAEIDQHQSESIIVDVLYPKQSVARIFLAIALICLMPLVLVRLYTLWGLMQRKYR